MKDMNQNNLPHPLIELISRIKSGQGKVQGDDFRTVAEDEILPENLKLLVYFAADLLDQREGWGWDTLTGLSNCSRIMESLRGAFSRYARHPEDRLTVILFDLDHLGDANKMGEGHKGGDKLIAGFAAILKKVYHSHTDMIGRFKVGDEFIVILRGGEEGAEKLNRKYDQELKRNKVFIGEQKVVLSATYVTRKLDPQKELDNQIDQMSKDLLEIKKQNMTKKEENEETEAEAVDEMEERVKKRERKKKREMDISGKNIFKLKELKDKKEENLSQDEE
jgi:diguanylate cyclase (GGDEF)-like protein